MSIGAELGGAAGARAPPLLHNRDYKHEVANMSGTYFKGSLM